MSAHQDVALKGRQITDKKQKQTLAFRQRHLTVSPNKPLLTLPPKPLGESLP